MELKQYVPVKCPSSSWANFSALEWPSASNAALKIMIKIYWFLQQIQQNVNYNTWYVVYIRGHHCTIQMHQQNT